MGSSYTVAFDIKPTVRCVYTKLCVDDAFEGGVGQLVEKHLSIIDATS